MDQKIKSEIEKLIATLGDECRPRRMAYYSVRFRIQFDNGDLGWTGSLPIATCCSAAAHKEALYEVCPSFENILPADRKIVGLEIKQDHVHFEGEAPVLEGEKVCDTEVLAPADAALLGLGMDGKPIEEDAYDKELMDDDDEDEDGSESWKSNG